jgi:serine/threonine protein kinase
MSGPPASRPDPDPLPGEAGLRRVGSYQLLREIGRGGMGIVYEARHEEIGRRAAVKILRAEYARDPVLTARLATEARAVSRIQHPGVVSAFDFGRADSGAPYLVMDFLEGVSLRARLAHLRSLGARLDVPAALRIATQLAAALTAAHEQDIIHRDLKPDSVRREGERPPFDPQREAGGSGRLVRSAPCFGGGSCSDRTL